MSDIHTITPMISPAFFLKPSHITEPHSWTGHIPFAFWITKNLRPEVLVELGTHSGNSFFAFCQSVDAHKLHTRCYAVDTWKGDKHAGFYGDEIYENVATYNEKHYHAFSSLLRMTFDEAIVHFSDSSIDLLHIDGMHTYEAVKHDFENWLPKMSNRGVVLFHDINVRERDFGVWKLWNEVSARYPHIAFDHSHGLGILFVGKEQSPVINALAYDLEDKSSQDIIKLLFSRMGRLVELEYQTSNHSRDIVERDERINALSLALDDRDERINALSLALDDRDQQINKIITSSSWRMTKPIRKITHSIRKRIRKVRYFFSHQQYHLSMIKDVLISKRISSMEAQAVFNSGWYGNEPIALLDRYRHREVQETGSSIANAAWRKYERDTA